MPLPNGANIVILASNYNPSIVSKEWLSLRGIFGQSVLNFVHRPVLSLVENQNLGISIDEQRLQLVVKSVTHENLTEANSIVARFIDTLPETPYKAIGFNYRYTLPEKGCDLERLLSPKPAKLRKVFSAEYKLGTIVAFAFDTFMATLTVTPPLPTGQATRISFNFHSDVANVDEIRARLALQGRTLEKAESIIMELCQNG